MTGAHPQRMPADLGRTAQGDPSGNPLFRRLVPRRDTLWRRRGDCHVSPSRDPGPVRMVENREACEQRNLSAASAGAIDLSHALHHLSAPVGFR